METLFALLAGAFSFHTSDNRKNPMNHVFFWQGNHGQYWIPDKFKSIKFRNDGWPDKRQKCYAAFMEWVREVDKP